MSFQAIYVSKITEGGVAEKDGKLLVGDKVISVSFNIDDIFYTHFYINCKFYLS